MKLQKRLTACTLTVLVVVSALFIPLTVQPAFALTLEEQLAQLEQQLAAIRGKKGDLQALINLHKSKIGTYSGEVGKLRGEMEANQLIVAELELQISELEVGIKLSQEKINEKEISLTKNQEEVSLLEDDATHRLTLGYRDYRSRGQNKVSLSDNADVNTYFKDSQYRQIIQKATSQAVIELLDVKQQMQKDQAELEQKQQEVQRNKAVIDEQKKEVSLKQDEIKAQMDKYYKAIYAVQGAVAGVNSQLNNISKEEAQKQAEAEKIRQEIFNSFNSIPNGQYVVKGTMIGRQGATGLATGPHVHFLTRYNGALYNPCTFLNGPGCGGSGVLPYPLKGTFYFTSGYGNRCFNGACSFHGAIDVASPTWNAPVYATHDGTIFKGVDQYGGLYIILCQNASNCKSGYQTGYWHFSSY